MLTGKREVFFRDVSAGLACGFIFFLGLESPFAGSLLILLCPLPLYLIGFAYGSRQAAIAAYAATFETVIVSGPDNAMPFILFIMLPSCFLLRQLTLWRGRPEAPEWYPASRALAKLSVLTAFIFFAGVGLMTELEGQHLQALMAHNLPDDMGGMDPQMAVRFQHLMSDDSFIIYALAVWGWVLLLYGLAVAANVFLHTRGLALRSSLALTPGRLPESLAILVFICAVPAVLDQGDNRFLAQTATLQLLLPYFLSGLALMHTASRERGMHLRKLWIGCFYVALVCTGWPALFVLGAGVYLQVAETLDRRKKMG